MKETKRAERRHHNRRLLKNRYKREVRNLFTIRHDEDVAETLGWCWRRAKRRLDTNVSCSCDMCGNPRRNNGFASWNGKKLTIQEVKAVDATQDGIEDFFEKVLDSKELVE